MDLAVVADEVVKSVPFGAPFSSDVTEAPFPASQ